MNSSPNSRSVQVCGVGIWFPGVPSAGEFAAGARGFDSTGDELPAGAALHPRVRRRTSRLSRAMVEAFEQAATQAKLDRASVATVFGSAFGESATMLGVLDQLCRGQELSPMNFATSVHSAASGAISINNKNRAFTTSLSADNDTAAAALLEAWGVLQQMNVPVIVTCGDERSPAEFIGDADRFELLAVSLSLLPLGMAVPSGEKALGHLSFAPAGSAADLRPEEVPGSIARNPQAGFLDLAATILAGRSGSVRLDRGKGNASCVHFEATP